jgi:hypothetical protein
MLRPFPAKNYSHLADYLIQHLRAVLESVDSHEPSTNAIFQLMPGLSQKMEEMVSGAWKGILDGTALLQSKDGHPVREFPCVCFLHHSLKRQSHVI